ncbi:MAG: alpha-amylase family glycosyl hydrolase [Oscillospiraceae bacterium]|jgi:glycosidase|nr:alpha-amylase family glycosyl hydrolase [Oscillospiraceae bacterium]
MNRRMKQILCAALAGTLLLSGCGSNASQTKAAAVTTPDDNYRTYCEVFVRSYSDGNSDGIGDLKGLTQKLGYLSETGFTGVWLMPICKSPSYHKYDVTDYCSIDPEYGTMKDFETFLAAAHKKGIRVILDFVMNHTSSQHPWFQQAVTYLKSLPKGAKPDSSKCPYVAYYNFHRANEPQANDRLLAGTEWAYEGVFSSHMPDLNLSNPAVKKEMEKAAGFWLSKGVDGFRLDAAKEYFSGNSEKSTEVLRWFTKYVKSRKKNAYLVAEVWDTLPEIQGYYKSGIDSIFNYPFGDSSGQIIKTVNSGNALAAQKYVKNLISAQDYLAQANPNMIDAPFLSNHDVGRIAGFVGGDEAKCKLAGAMNLTMSGSAFVYYGEELGMKGSGDDPSKRAPMYWDTKASGGMTQPPPGCTVPQHPFGSYAQQETDSNSVYQYYRKAIALRTKYPEVARGKVSAVSALSSGSVCAVRKRWKQESCVILYNIGPSSVKVPLTSSDASSLHLQDFLVTGKDTVTQSGKELVMPPLSVAVLK